MPVKLCELDLYVVANHQRGLQQPLVSKPIKSCRLEIDYYHDSVCLP
jgi:hypothetical protein